MKTNVTKQTALFLFGMLVLFISLAHTQPQNELLLPFLSHDSLATKAAANNVKASVPLQTPVQTYVHQYIDENAEIFDHIRETNSAKFGAIQKILVKRGIPAGMMYLAVVESELKNNATSHSGAAGIWQLMPETARTFGLKVNGKTDERRLTYQSSVAAADYLTALYKQFDDWLLVVAAYNCGSGNVCKAIKQSGSREFWKLQKFLPAESRSHVKHFIAVHFYYEKAGSIVTLTKKERNQYLASLNENKDKKEEDTAISAPVFSSQADAAAMGSLQEDGYVRGLVR